MDLARQHLSFPDLGINNALPSSPPTRTFNAFCRSIFDSSVRACRKCSMSIASLVHGLSGGQMTARSRIHNCTSPSIASSHLLDLSR